MRLLLIVLIALALGTAAASAGSSPTLTVSPASAVVGDVVAATGCGYQANHWFEMDTYGPNTTVDGPLDSRNIGRVGSDGCISGTLLNPVQAAGTYSTYVYDCGAKGTGIGCVYGSHNKLLVDVDFTVS